MIPLQKLIAPVKNTVIAILLTVSVVFGGLYLQQIRETGREETTAFALQQKVSELQTTVQEQEGEAVKLRGQVEATRAEALAKIREAVEIGEALKQSNQTRLAESKAPAKTNSSPPNLLSEMFKNPEMKEMIKNQQKVALGAMVDKNYGRFFKDMNLIPEQASTLKDMILNKQLAAADVGMSMFTGSQEPDSRKAMAQQMKTASDAADAQIKDFLGDDNFSQFQSYEKSMAERMTVSGLKDQLGAGTAALTDDQEQQLIQAMTQERQNFKFTTDLSDKSKFDGDFASMFNEDKMSGFFKESVQLNQQFVGRAQSILSPDQLNAFQKYLDNQQTMQKAGMQMAAKMFAPAKAGGN